MRVYDSLGRKKTALSGAGTGTVTTVSVVSANGVSGSVATATTTPAITVVLGDITPTSISVAESATAPVIVNADTIATSSIGSSRVAPAGAVTGIILQSGTHPGQKITVINQSAAVNTVTMDVSGTSHVSNGTACVIAGLTAKSFTWNSVISLWYPES